MREKKGLTQPEMADMLGVTRGQISSYERGSTVSVDKLSEIGEAFHLDLNKFVKEEMNSTNYESFFFDPSQITPKPKKVKITEQIQMLVDKLDSGDLDAAERRHTADKIMHLVHTLKEQNLKLKNSLTTVMDKMQNIYDKL